jgi:hypothetical protein
MEWGEWTVRGGFVGNMSGICPLGDSFIHPFHLTNISYGPPMSDTMLGAEDTVTSKALPAAV